MYYLLAYLLPGIYLVGYEFYKQKYICVDDILCIPFVVGLWPIMLGVNYSKVVAFDWREKASPKSTIIKLTDGTKVKYD